MGKAKSNIEIKSSKVAKVPLYTEELRNALRKGKEIGLEKALNEWAERIIRRRLAWYEK